MAREYLLIYTSYEAPVSLLDDGEAGRLFKGILTYARTGEDPGLNGAEKVAFNFMKSQIDGSMNYKRGPGRPRKASTEAQEDAPLFEQEEAPAGASPPEQEVKPERRKRRKEGPEKIQYAEFVTMTEDEHNKLKAKYGSAALERMIEMLDNYKGSSGKKYVSDYRAILNWVANRYAEEERRNPHRTPPITESADTPEDWEKFYQEGYSS